MSKKATVQKGKTGKKPAPKPVGRPRENPEEENNAAMVMNFTDGLKPRLLKQVPVQGFKSLTALMNQVLTAWVNKQETAH